ncbi:MAG: HD domain-containing protein [Methanomicrobiales archaeon]|nr:HD domain-containing protein [Methanomicrobiales archaeon]
MKFIKDPVHGYIEVPQDLGQFLDSSPLQRLRHIRQLGFAYLVYPGANHSRFEHSLGTMHLAAVMCRHLGLDEEESRLVTLTALLHDCGHGPFSHATEPIMREFTDRAHDEIDDLLGAEPLATLLRAASLEPGDLMGILAGRHPLSTVIHGDLDVDRMDYLLRDAHYTGVPYGTVDAQRLIQNTLLSEQGLVLAEGGVNAAESLLIARTLMRPAVYVHHVTRIATSMIQRALIEECAERRPAEINLLMRMDDAGLMHALLRSHHPAVVMLSERVYNRNLFKRAVYVGPDQVNVAALRAETPSLQGQRRIAETIADKAGVKEWQVLVDNPPLPADLSMEVKVRNRHTLVHLSEISPLVETLNLTRRAQWRVGVYADPPVRKAVEEAAMEVLHVRKPTKQDRLAMES